MAARTKEDACWQQLLTADKPPEFTVLATKLTVARLRRIVKQQPSAMQQATEELFQYYATNSFAQRELPGV